ncbi:F-box only protein 16-like [Acanthaster planci]|uniref:F-box only protein 16-like n=1 Tax=Acanthaster planci TaxID=133434 RepID=A0A8B7ZTU8_ACAPL|nr:F-box only protein 16-like [Acanthaster planci]
MAWSGEQKRLENKKKNLDSKIRFSAWTPMNHAPTNDKVYEERKDVLRKWFDRWNDSQRRASIVEIMERCSLGQLQFMKQIAVSKLPIVCQDFARELPRAICLYIFSFLDPRSLCRCAQVCWYWKYLTELDQIWMPKALRLGWYLTFSPSPYETGVWKRHYLENVRSLHYVNPKESKVPASLEMNGNTTESPKTEKTSKRATPKLRSRPPKPLDHKPWRVNDPVADNLRRNNYLDNPDEILQQRQKRLERSKHVRERRNSASASDLTKDSEMAVKKTRASVNMAYKLKKAKSSSNIAGDDKPASNLAPDRPMWAQNVGNLHPDMLVTANTVGGKDASRRPPPLTKNIPPSAAVRRNERDLPEGDLFPTRGWQQIDVSDDEG